MRSFFNALGWGLLWSLAHLPLSFSQAFGRGLGRLLFLLPSRRKNVVLTNLRLCFPKLTKTELNTLAQKHFILLFQSFAERGPLWLGTVETVQKMVNIHSAIDLSRQRPRIYLSMHMIGIEAGAIALSQRLTEEGHARSVTLYTPMKNAFFEQFIKNARQRFGGVMLPRSDQARELVRLIRSGTPLVLSPDMDFGERDSTYAPFFGVQACTLLAVPRLARLTGAEIIPTFTRLQPDGKTYTLEIGEPLNDFPSADPVADATRMNALFEAYIRPQPAQYYWVHKRFKHRPNGEKNVY
jgi:Kdo2-lipid IVA lauroyltransferase/acyltransferase